jgi:predicted dehydrogenase
MDAASGTSAGSIAKSSQLTSFLGASMLDIGIGHQLDVVTHLLGEFSSVSATTTTAYPIATVLDTSGKPTGNTVTSTVSDHIAFSGELKSGAVASVT